MTENADTYELTSGLPDDFNCEVVDAWFGTDARYNNGQSLLLFWKATTDHEENPVMDGDIRFGVGSDWESLDGGKTAEHPKGKTKYNNQSAIGMLIARALELGAGSTLQARGPAQSADVWIGTKWHMKRESFPYTIQGEAKTREMLLPSEFLGEEGGTVTTAAPPEPKVSALEGMDPDLVEKLRSLKASAPSHNAFVDSAMELTEVTNDHKIIHAIATPDGVYAEL